MTKKVLKRQDVNELETWDLKRLYQTEELYLRDLEKLEKLTNDFVSKYQGKIKDAIILNEALTTYMELLKVFTYTSTYQSLHSSVDQRNSDNLTRSSYFDNVSNSINLKLTFFETEILNLSEETIREAISLNSEFSVYLEKLLNDKLREPSYEVKKALSRFSRTLNAPYKNYNTFKFADLDFKTFKVDSKELPMSFTLFENEYQNDSNTNIRRRAFEHFYGVLASYQNGFGSNYEAHLLKEKAYSDLKGYDSITDYLLDSQKVSLDMYHRQIDLIMKHLSKHMRKYVSLIKDIYGLDKLTYADLHLAIDPDLETNVTIEQAKNYAVNALKVLGSEYENLTKRSFSERWIDFPQNLGKSTGGFCASPYQKGSYILLNWNGQMNEVFVLAHEIGHAGHFHFSSHHQNIFNTRPSMYFIEAPSTMNELLMADYLSEKKADLRFRRWVLTNLISRTYYHNMVTHLLEAAFQREVYEAIDAGKPINGQTLNNYKLKVLKEFWGDTVEIPDYAGLTWMRQPHYFMGLYPYTYSAGLTVSTNAYLKLKNNELTTNQYLDVLRAGGTKKPLDLAKMLNIDLSTDKPLLEVIAYIGEMVDEVVSITNKLKG